MRKELSVLMLAARSSIYKICMVLLGMVVLQIVFLRRGWQGAVSLERIIEVSYIEKIFYIAFLGIYFILIWTESKKGSQFEYTLRRLGISRKRVFFLWAGYNSCCLFILFAVQIFISICIGRVYLEWADPMDRSAQSLFLAFWRNDFLHSLLPLAEVSRWIRNGLMILAMGLVTAFFGGEELWNRKMPVVWIGVLFLLVFSDSAGSWRSDLIKGILFLGIILFILAGVIRRGWCEE